MEQLLQPVKGILDPLIQLGFKPTFQQNILVLELDEEQFKNIFLNQVAPQYRQFIDLKIENNKIRVFVKLF
jgi:ABC-type phosphate transport system substrate-binding protein